MNQHYLQLYADFIVKVGVNVRPRQNFIVRCPVTMPDFAHACVRAGYEAGAKTVVVRWEDDKLTRLNMELADEKDLTAMKPMSCAATWTMPRTRMAAAPWQSTPLTPKHWPGWMRQDQPRQPGPPQIPETLAGIHDERPCTVVCGRCSGTVLGRKSVPRHSGGGSDGKAVGTHL